MYVINRDWFQCIICVIKSIAIPGLSVVTRVLNVGPFVGNTLSIYKDTVLTLSLNELLTSNQRPNLLRWQLNLKPVLRERGEVLLLLNRIAASSLFDVKAFIKNYCNNNNVEVVAIEHCDDSYWNYLSNDTEIDYTICQNLLIKAQ